MSCPQYILSDDEITIINSNFIVLDMGISEMEILIGQLPLPSGGIKTKVLAKIVQLNTALNNLRPLAVHLYELQSRGEST